ncbi:ANTAR domain-containing protein [uncultured Paludibaculum sp.]|uniref:ANTAR domain-containing protein n=1 Tax=uncultured Paludibaculum sp. TaxID=1765020 RepID=UPI002AAAF870|nr:ANTAR domain-containing protein [uncultured Paludibaculum sp.]
MPELSEYTRSISTLEESILHEISRIANNAPAFTWAVERTQSLLRREAELQLLLVDLDSGSPLARQEVQDFLALPNQAKLLYTTSLIDKGQEIGRVVVGFADPALEPEAAHRIAEFVGQQLGSLLGRARLRSRRTALVQELERLRDRLDERKILARAEGIIASRHGLSSQQARAWLESQSRSSGKAASVLAEQLVLLHTRAVRLSA